MTQELQPYREIPVDAPLAFPEASPEGVEQNPLVMVVGVLRRRWRTVVSLFLLLVATVVPVVWIVLQKTYTATAQVQVAPILPRILYEDEDTRVMPLFDNYLNTQAERMSSHQVLTTALADPGVQGLPLLETADPVSALRESLEVKNINKTQLLEISVTRNDRNEAVRLAKAVVEAYMARVVGSEAADERTKREVLEKERERLRAKLDQQREEIRKLAEEYGTATETTFGVLRQSIIESTLETKRELERTEVDIIQLRERIRQLEEGSPSPLLLAQLAAPGASSQRQGGGSSPVVIPTQDSALRREAVENDPVVRSLREQLLEVSARLVRLRSGLTDEHREVIAAKEKKDQLTAELEKERVRAGADVDKELATQHKQLLDDAKVALKQQLTAAEQRREVLAKRVEKQDSDGMALGRRGLEIQSLQEQVEVTKQEFDRIDARIKQLVIESQRPARVTIASGAEVRPKGIEDKRVKLTAAAIIGALCLGFAVAFLKDRLDSHLYAPREVEAGMGLRVLGAVPCLSELKAGRVTQEDFIESYRLVRASLAGIRPDGIPPRSILVTSAQAAEGKTSLAVSLAASLAEPGTKVLLIDGDTQAPTIGRLLQISPSSCLQAVLFGQQSLADAVMPSRLRGVDILVAKTNGDSGRGALNNQSSARLLRDAAAMYDHIVIDSPPALGAADALVWASVAEGVIVSSLAGQSDVTAMRLACRRLGTVGARLLGAVVANVSRNEEFYSYSGYSYKDGHGDRKAGHAKARELPVVQFSSSVSPDQPEG